VWWYTSVIPVLGILKQEDGEFKASLNSPTETLSQSQQTKSEW
jgi:hypothetical protein